MFVNEVAYNFVTGCSEVRVISGEVETIGDLVFPQPAKGIDYLQPLTPRGVGEEPIRSFEIYEGRVKSNQIVVNGALPVTHIDLFARRKQQYDQTTARYARGTVCFTQHSDQLHKSLAAQLETTIEQWYNRKGSSHPFPQEPISCVIDGTQSISYKHRQVGLARTFAPDALGWESLHRNGPAD